jgi:hypothetical protein
MENQNRLDLENGVMELFELLEKEAQNGGWEAFALPLLP